MKRFPFCHFPYAKTLEEAARLQPDGVCIGSERSQRRATNETKAQSGRRLTWRTRQINSSKLRSHRDNSNLLLSDEDHVGTAGPCSHSLPPKKFFIIRGRAAAARRRFKRSLLPSSGAHSSPLSPVLLCLRSDAFGQSTGRLYIPASRNIQANG